MDLFNQPFGIRFQWRSLTPTFGVVTEDPKTLIKECANVVSRLMPRDGGWVIERGQFIRVFDYIESKPGAAEGPYTIDKVLKRIFDHNPRDEQHFYFVLDSEAWFEHGEILKALNQRALDNEREIRLTTLFVKPNEIPPPEVRPFLPRVGPDLKEAMASELVEPMKPRAIRAMVKDMLSKLKVAGESQHIDQLASRLEGRNQTQVLRAMAYGVILLKTKENRDGDGYVEAVEEGLRGEATYNRWPV